jgi:hypothetical protein
MINPHDLGEFQLADNIQKVSINGLVGRVKREFKAKLIQSQIEVLGLRIGLTTSKTRFGGDRLWFICPLCGRRCESIYRHGSRKIVGCRHCLNVKYRKQRYKDMIEGEISGQRVDKRTQKGNIGIELK